MATFTKLPTADPDVDLNHCDSSYDENMSESTCAAGDQSRPTTPREFEELSVGYAGEPTAQSCRTYLGSMMDHRGRRKHSHAVTDGDDVHDGLLADAFAKRRAQRSRTWYNYCIFGGISGFTILSVSSSACRAPLTCSQSFPPSNKSYSWSSYLLLVQ